MDLILTELGLFKKLTYDWQDGTDCFLVRHFYAVFALMLKQPFTFATESWKCSYPH
jgi:hypothetical protein